MRQNRRCLTSKYLCSKAFAVQPKAFLESLGLNVKLKFLRNVIKKSVVSGLIMIGFHDQQGKLVTHYQYQFILTVQ